MELKQKFETFEEYEMKKEFIELKHMIDTWKQYEIKKAVIQYDCGNDNFNLLECKLIKIDDYEYPDDIPVIKNLGNGLIDLSFKNVAYYENSEDTYMGEFGIVIVTLENNVFVFEKKQAGENFYITETYEVNVSLDNNQIDILNQFDSFRLPVYVEFTSFNDLFFDGFVSFKNDSLLPDEQISNILDLFNFIITPVNEKMDLISKEQNLDFIEENLHFTSDSDDTGENIGIKLDGNVLTVYIHGDFFQTVTHD